MYPLITCDLVRPSRALTLYEPHFEQVEWQKRGLPHAHILLILDEPIHPDRFDEYVQAELPDHPTHPILRDLVETHMLHGPCGPSVARNPPCWQNGKCTKRFPTAVVVSNTHTQGWWRRGVPPETGRALVHTGE